MIAPQGADVDGTDDAGGDGDVAVGDCFREDAPDSRFLP